jgi:hypothetical protein
MRPGRAQHRPQLLHHLDRKIRIAQHALDQRIFVAHVIDGLVFLALKTGEVVEFKKSTEDVAAHEPRIGRMHGPIRMQRPTGGQRLLRQHHAARLAADTPVARLHVDQSSRHLADVADPQVFLGDTDELELIADEAADQCDARAHHFGRRQRIVLHGQLGELGHALGQLSRRDPVLANQTVQLLERVALDGQVDDAFDFLRREVPGGVGKGDLGDGGALRVVEFVALGLVGVADVLMDRPAQAAAGLLIHPVVADQSAGVQLDDELAIEMVRQVRTGGFPLGEQVAQHLRGLIRHVQPAPYARGMNRVPIRAQASVAAIGGQSRTSRGNGEEHRARREDRTGRAAPARRNEAEGRTSWRTGAAQGLAALASPPARKEARPPADLVGISHRAARSSHRAPRD